MNNKTMYGLNLYIPFEDLDAYIHEHIDEKYRDHTFMPIKVEVNELNCDIEIKLLSVSPIETDSCRYKLDLNALQNDSKPQRGLRAKADMYDDDMDPALKDIISGKGLSHLDTNLNPNKPLPPGIRKEFRG